MNGRMHVACRIEKYAMPGNKEQNATGFIRRAARAAGAVELSSADFLRGFRVRFGTIQLAHNNTAHQDSKDSVLGTSVRCPCKHCARPAPASKEHSSLPVRPLRIHLPNSENVSVLSVEGLTTNGQEFHSLPC